MKSALAMILMGSMLASCPDARADESFTDELAILAVSREDQTNALKTRKLKKEVTITEAVRVLTTFKKVTREQYLEYAHQPSGARGTVTLKGGKTFSWTIEPEYAATVKDAQGEATYLLHPKLMDGTPSRNTKRGVRKYTKVWTDDYGNYHKEIYRAYTRTLKDGQGEEFVVEIRHGKATDFHENGNKAWEVDYRDGKREGEFTSWADNGVRTGFATFRLGQVHGPSTQWSRDGRKMREDTYENGKLHGVARWWDRDGNLLTTGTYRDGQPWDGTFPELHTQPAASSSWVIRRYEGGKKVGEEKLTGNWWW